MLVSQIQQLYSEIFRLNNLLSEGRPVDAVLKETNDDYTNELLEMRQQNAELQRNLNGITFFILQKYCTLDW